MNASPDWGAFLWRIVQLLPLAGAALLPILGAVTGWLLARARHREKALWSVLCLLFPPLVVVLLCLGARRDAP